MCSQAQHPRLDILRSYSREFSTKLRRINSFTSHSASIGTAHEGILRRFLQQYTPRRYAVSEGFVVDSKGSASSQCDVIIWSDFDHSPFYREGDFAIVQAESVRAVIEIKTSLTKATLQSAFKQLLPIHKMNDKIHTAIFAFESQPLKLCLEHIIYGLDLEVHDAVDSICAMSGWTLQRLGMFPTEQAGLGVIGTPQAIKRDLGDLGYVPFMLLLPPDDDPGYDLIAFLSFLFQALESSPDPTVSLYSDGQVYYSTPIFPGIGNAEAEGVSRENVRRFYEELIKLAETL